MVNLIVYCLSNNYTMGCPPVRGLSYGQVDKHAITILYIYIYIYIIYLDIVPTP